MKICTTIISITKLREFFPHTDAPVCAHSHEELLGALKHETLMLKCEVDASPPAESFQWTFNSSGEPTDLTSKLHPSEVCVIFFFFAYFVFQKPQK